MRNMRKNTRSAFTLVELMIIVAILCDLMLVALPAFMRSRNTAQNSRFISDLRTATGAFEMYAAENNKYPAAAATGVVPTGMNAYLNGFPWGDINSIGGAYTWNPGYQSATAAIQLSFARSMDDVRMMDIDQRMDNGVLATGNFRKVDGNNYYYILEQ